MTETETRWASHSSLVKHRDCPQRWYYASIRRLEKIDPEDVAVERDFGSWWHAVRAAESIERGRSLGSLHWTPEEITTTDNGPRIPTAVDDLVETVFAAAEDWWSKMHPDAQAVWEARIGGGLVDRLDYVLDRWQEEWADDIANEEPLAVELKWERALPEMPAPWLGAGFVVSPNTTLVGYIDEIYYDRRRAMVVARDHKTSKTLGIMHAGDDMMDSQLQLYAWGSAPIVLTWGRGPVRATAYDRARMTAPSQPAITGTGTLSKSTTDYDLHTYREFVGEGVPWGEQDAYFASGPRKGKPKFGVYTAEEAVIERLSTPAEHARWFQRTLTPLNPTLIKAHLRAAVDTSVDMQQSYERAKAVGEAARNISSGGCRWCDFVGLCRAEMIGGSDGEWVLSEFKLRERPRDAGR